MKTQAKTQHQKNQHPPQNKGIRVIFDLIYIKNFWAFFKMIRTDNSWDKIKQINCSQEEYGNCTILIRLRYTLDRRKVQNFKQD